MNWICSVEQAEKRYGSEVILGPVSLVVKQGEIIGIQGQNGAGKSTLLKLCAGLLAADAGRIRYGTDVKAAIGYVPQEIALYPTLSGYDNLEYWAVMQGLVGKEKKEKIRWALEKMDLQDKARKPVETYSGGMKRRLNLAAALMRPQRLLLLDEVTAGADGKSAEKILECIREMAKQGAGVLMVTHRLEEWSICHRLLTLEQGRVQAEQVQKESEQMGAVQKESAQTVLLRRDS